MSFKMNLENAEIFIWSLLNKVNKAKSKFEHLQMR